MRVAVAGLGYVGLVTAAGLAEWGHDVLGIENSEARLASLKAGALPLHEPGLDELWSRHVERRRVTIAGNSDRIDSVQVVIVAVGTHDGNGGWQTDTIRSCLEELVPRMADDAVLVIRSTLPPEFLPGLGPLVAQLRSAAGRTPIPVLINPEFTREGQAVRDFLTPERVVIGIVSDPDGRGARAVRKIYASVTTPILQMTAADAVLAKLGSNLFLATKISFANELARLCEAFGGDVTAVVDALSYDERIGGSFMRAGIGFGGSCLPHQVTMTIRSASQASLETPLLSAVDHINHRQRHVFVDRIREAIEGSVDSSIEGARVALLGLTFKPGTDDLRDAPALTIAAELLDAGAQVVAYDPMPTARIRAEQLLPGLKSASTAFDALQGADAVGLVTEWSEFAALDWAAVRSIVAGTTVVDGRNALDPAVLTAAGFQYVGFGRRVDRAMPGQEPIAGVTAPGDAAIRIRAAVAAAE
jgi:UDPglucose 6-dehydrogenase